MKAEIVSYLESSRYLQQQLLPFYSSQAGRLVLEKTEKVVREQLPLYVTELEGMAAGAGLDFNIIMTLNVNFPTGNKGGGRL